MMKKMCIAILGLAFALPILAKDLSVKLNIMQMQALKEQEYTGDELYFNVAEYTKKGLQRFYRVPETPIHLRSSYLEQVKNFNLWQTTLKEGQSAQVVVALIEEDLAPWDLDDLLGELKLKVKNEAGKLITEWAMPNTTDQGRALANTEGEQRRFEFKSSGAHYLIDLQLSSV